MFRYIFLYCLLLKVLCGQDYFIHLTNAGLSQKSNFVNNQFENITSLTDPSLIKNSGSKFRGFESVRNSEQFPEKWLVLHSVANESLILKELSKNGLIDFYEPVGHFKIDFGSADSLAAQQWYLDKINVKDAWSVTKGSSKIIISIIDTGIDYIHPDLQKAIWVNSAEDLNGNGILDSADINNIDDDGNGYVDDVVGWDFTDAPRFADSGDYLNEDNQPWDEFGSGHGTQVAGIIAAEDNNNIGIAGIAPGVKIMNLRAGTASGYLEEDDVGRAILYALNNGARIINMSFGDTEVSRFLKDVISYASRQGIIFVASSGNSNSSEPHYPSALPQVISVGASTENDGIAGFSNYGNSLDIVAPGTDMVSTAIGGKYNSVNGTSFSAPVVSAVAGLILSNDNSISADQVRNILKTSADDIYYQGWDKFSAMGRVSAYNALKIPVGGILKISSPEVNSAVANENIALIGSAAHPDLISTDISYGIGALPEKWTVIKVLEQQQVIDDTLAVFHPQSGDTTYTIKVVMHLFNNRSDEIHHTFMLDRSSPHIRNIKIIDLWDGPSQSKLVTFDTDDICTSMLFLRKVNSTDNFNVLSSAYETKNHRFKIDKTQFSGVFEFYIQAKNKSSLLSTNDNNGKLYRLSLSAEWNRMEFTQLPWTLPAGFILNTATDLDHDGNDEIIISRYDATNGFGPVEIYEFNNGRFDLKLKTGFTAIPRAAGDVDQDGKSDLLLGFGQRSYLFEANSPDSFPTQLIWQDTVNFWAAAYTDLDNDNHREITGRVDNDYIVLENNSNNSFYKTASLTNPTDGENKLGVPKIELTDLNHNGLNDIIFGDYDGDLIAYTSNADNAFKVLATGQTIHPNATEMITSDSNGVLYTATHTSDNFNYEHEFDARYWSIQSFSETNGKLIPRDTINVFGFSDTKDFDSGLIHHIFDNHSFLYASFFPDLYIFEKKANQWTPVWFYNQARSNTILVHDFDHDGNDEFYFNDGKNIIGFTASQNKRPLAPFAFNASPADSTIITLSWQSVANASSYNIYKGNNTNNLSFYVSTSGTIFSDTVITGQKYYFAVTTIDSSYSMAESFFSNIDSAQTLPPPVYTGYEFSGTRQIIIKFNLPLMINPQKPVEIYRSSHNDFASSVVITNKKDLLISFTDPFLDQVNDTISVHNIFGETGVPINEKSRIIHIIFKKSADIPYVKTSKWLSGRRLLIVFNEAMDFYNSPQQFSVIPSGNTKKITIADSSHTSIIVEFSEDTYIGATGQSSYLLLDGIVSNKGIALENTKISLYQETTGLKNVIVYPQPVKPENSELIFANLPGDVTITIFNINGNPVKHLSPHTEYGGVRWNLNDDSGNKVASGIYLYDLHWKGKAKQGKIVIIR